MNNLQIERTNTESGVLISCSGRLDANHAGHLQDYIQKLVREGHYHIALDLTQVEYLSSAGIRTLVSQYKSLNAVNGMFYIAALSENVRMVLDMVGMEKMLCQKPMTKVVVDDETKTEGKAVIKDFRFEIMETVADAQTHVALYGKPGLVFQADYEAAHARKIDAEDKRFAFGLGAIGDDFEACRDRFGEYMMLGGNVVYLPADGSHKPDYMQSSGKLIASVIELYGIGFTENYAKLIRFEPHTNEQSISLSDVVESISNLTGYEAFTLVMVAESGGLVGTSLNASPVDKKTIFTYPDIKDTVNFTTEPAHNKMLTISAGIVVANAKANAEQQAFVRPLYAGSKQAAHVHSVVFPYIPLKKTQVNLYEIIDYLFENSEIVDLLHLTNDNRDITGLGESRFVHGFCWVSPINSIHQV
jgi:anti-anti-sigma factor